MRFFNTAGPVNYKDHYCLPPLERFDLAKILMLLEQKKYFVLHAPRQVGKTSFLLAPRDYLNKQRAYDCLYINIEAAQTAREKVNSVMAVILREIALRASGLLQDDFPESIRSQSLAENGYGALNTLLTLWARHNNKPIILLIDEIDSLVGDSLISVLRQLRAGHDKRPENFPHSIILCGVRDVRDYRLHVGNKDMITGGNAFNIKAKSLRLGDFNKRETLTLYREYMDKCSSEDGHLVIFDRSEKPWEEKIFKREEVHKNQKIIIWGM